MERVDALTTAHPVTGAVPLLRMTPRLEALAETSVQPQEPLSVGAQQPLACPRR